MALNDPGHDDHEAARAIFPIAPDFTAHFA
jgi:hypothetical protein